MTPASPDGNRPVVVVTGGGGGIGAAIATELGRRDWFVVTVDPLVTLDGSEQLPTPEDTTAGRIVAAGGAARASAVSVTDRDGVQALFRDLVDELGRLDAVINVAGISRPTGFARGREEDWLGVLSVHLDGYLNVLDAALPIMAAAGRGRILGVTSGSGWRQADAGAYSCAKRAVAALTWELGRQAPPGVVVNAISPIAVTRMVTAALGAAPDGGRASGGSSTGGGRASGGSSTGGLALGAMPAPEELGPLGAHLVSDGIDWCNGRVLFAGGSEVALVDEPRLLEVVRADGPGSLARLLDAVGPAALAPAEAKQASTGGGNPRFGSIFADGDGHDGGGNADANSNADADADANSSTDRTAASDANSSTDRTAASDGNSDGVATAAATCAVVADHPVVAAAVTTALEARGVRCHAVPPGTVGQGFAAAAAALAGAAEQTGPLDAVVVALADASPATTPPSGWERVLAEHAGIVDQVRADAAWARAVADHAGQAERPVRLVTLTDAVTAGGRSRAQASAQLARAARRATDDRVAAFAISVEADEAGSAAVVGELAAHLVASPDAPALSGAELVVGPGWFGLRSHPRPSGSITFGGPELPAWFDEALQGLAGGAGPAPVAPLDEKEPT
jgi:NAD(P)-dependent dehydrogenase (short-subunit alcohol dehydrogenase family)